MKIFGSFSELVATIFRKDNKAITLRPNDITYSGTTDIELPETDGNEVIVGRISADQADFRLKNKDLEDSSVVFVDSADTTKKVKIDVAGATGTSTTLLSSQTSNKTLTLPDITDTLVARTTSDTLTNKTINAALNTLSNITNTEVSASAAIARTKLASGTASHVIINDGSGVLSSEAILDKTRGGTGVSSTATFPASGVIVTETATETLSNKTLDNTTTINIKDTLLTLQDNGDATKLARFDLSGIPTATTKTYTTPDFSGGTDSLLTRTSSHTAGSRLTNKHLDDNTTAFVDNSDTSRSFKLNVNASQTTGTQIDFTLPTLGSEIVGDTNTQTLTNKTLTSPDINTAIRILNQGQLQLREATGGGTNQVNIQAPAALSADYTLTLPIDDGTANQVLQTDGSGVLSWATIASTTPANAGNVYSDGATLLSTPDLRTANLTTINVSIASGITHQHPNLTIDTTSTYTVTGNLIAQNTLIVSGTLTIIGSVIVDPIIPQNASASNAGLVSTEAQTFAGNKSFLQGIMTSDVAGEDVTVPLAYTLSHNYLTVGNGRTYSIAGQLVTIGVLSAVGTGIISATGSGIINVLG